MFNVEKQRLERELKATVKGAITMNLSQIARARGKGRKWAAELMQGYSFYNEGARSKEYDIKDVAEAMLGRRCKEE